MKFWLAVLMFGLLSVCATRIQAQAMGHGHGMTTHFVYNNLTFRYSITDDDFKDTPSWNPETGDSPLSTHEALDVARRTLNRFVPDGQRFEVEKINLERFEPHKWVFEVGFRCWDQRCSDTAVSFTVFVKMDGSVIAALGREVFGHVVHEEDFAALGLNGEHGADLRADFVAAELLAWSAIYRNV